jgi:hypothetical protein
VSIKVTTLAVVDGDQLMRALALDGMANATLDVAFVVRFNGAEVSCASREEVLELLVALRPTKAQEPPK